MRLYPHPKHPVTGPVTIKSTVYEQQDDGSYLFPEPVGQELHAFRAHWETGPERIRRQAVEERKRKRDPASLYERVDATEARLASIDERLAELIEIVKAGQPAKPSRRRKSAEADPAGDDDSGEDEDGE